jgi:hypothetical protein
VTTIGAFGDDPGEFIDPVGVGLDSEDNLYITEFGNHRIQKFAPVAEAALRQAAGRAGGDGHHRAARRRRRRGRHRARPAP